MGRQGYPESLPDHAALLVWVAVVDAERNPVLASWAAFTTFAAGSPQTHVLIRIWTQVYFKCFEERLATHNDAVAAVCSGPPRPVTPQPRGLLPSPPPPPPLPQAAADTHAIRRFTTVIVPYIASLDLFIEEETSKFSEAAALASELPDAISDGVRLFHEFEAWFQTVNATMATARSRQDSAR